ncbi:MAG TPA: hypothetical protein ENH89_00010 [Aurantimonas coralicida]|uniref:Uncharacterized protein n=1 Tax=Aurantimonas coralicida TaxID=182270 RepID=A0A9C9NCQ8_9HYPH|nr:hypothetical protein [Aurantimonas coralicida]
MTDAALDTRGPGDNLAPPDANPLQDRLAEDHADLIARRDELLASAERTPATVGDEEMNKRFATLAKLLAALVKKTETERVGEKEFFLDGGRQVDGWFKQITDPVKKVKASIETRQTEWQRKVAAEERKRLVNIEREARQEAIRLENEAARQEQLARDAASLDDAVAAEAAAKQAAADAEVAAKAADAKPADLSRTRSDEGAVASLRVWWDFRDLDRSRLDLEALRQHLGLEALEKAVRSFIKADGHELRGVVIFENSRTVNH